MVIALTSAPTIRTTAHPRPKSYQADATNNQLGRPRVVVGGVVEGREGLVKMYGWIDRWVNI